MDRQDPTLLQLDEEQRSLLRDLVRNEPQLNTRQIIESLSDCAAENMEWFNDQKLQYGGSYRQVHDELRHLAILADQHYELSKAGILADKYVTRKLGGGSQRELREEVLKALRSKVRSLSPAAIAKLEQMIDLKTNCLPDNRLLRLASVPKSGAIPIWLPSLSDEELVEAILTIVLDGVVVVKGRARPHGKKTAARIEPYILGTARGGRERKRSGGRPQSDLEFILASRLAHGWEHATGTEARGGRRERSSPFTGFIYRVMGWLDVDDRAEDALRNFWDEINASPS